MQTIKGYFSRQAAWQRGQEKDEEDSSDQDVALARKELLHDLIDEAQKQVGL